MLTSFSCDDNDNNSKEYYGYIENPRKKVVVHEPTPPQFVTSNIPPLNPETIQLQTMRAMGYMPNAHTPLPREDSNLPFNATLYKASIGNNPTVNTALYQVLPQQMWDIDPSALCTASSKQEKEFISLPQKQLPLVSGKSPTENRAERSGWDVLSQSDYAKREYSLPPEIQARQDAARVTSENRLQDRRLLTQSVSRQGPREGFAFGSSAFPLAYEKLVFPTTEAPEGLDSCQDPATDEADTLGFVPNNSKWSQQEMGPIPPTADDTGQFPFQGNTRFLASHTDKTTGQTYMVFGRDPLLDNAGKVYDEIPSRQIGKTSRRLEEMMGNRRLSSPMPNRSEVPNQLVIPDKQGLNRAVHEGERMNTEKRIAKANFFNRDNGIRPPPPEAARTETGSPYTGFVGIREMARYNNVNQPSMKEPEFAMRKYDQRIMPQSSITIRNDTLAPTRQIFEVAGISGSSRANEVDPLGSAVHFSASVNSNVLSGKDFVQEGGSNFNDRVIANSRVNVNNNFHNSLPAQDYLGGHDYEMAVRNNLVSGISTSTMPTMGDRETSSNYDMNGITRVGTNVSAAPGSFSFMHNPLLNDSANAQNTYNRIETNVSAAPGSFSFMHDPLLNDSASAQNTYNRIETNVSAAPGSFSFMHDPLLNDSASAQNTYNRIETNVVATPGSFTQLPSMDNFIPKDDIQWFTSIAYKGSSGGGVSASSSSLPATDLHTDQSWLNPGLAVQSGVSARVIDSVHERNNESNQFLNPALSVQTNVSGVLNSNIIPDRQYENKMSSIAMDINHSFAPTSGHGGVTTAKTTPLLTDNGQVDNDRVIPYDYQAFSRRTHELVEAHRELDGKVPANVRIPQYDDPTYLLGLRIDSEMKAAKYKDAEASTMLLRAEVSNAQLQKFEEYNKRREIRRSQPKKKKANYESDTDTDCDMSV